jgi:uncharacterized protein YbjT (DUF2867 family)
MIRKILVTGATGKVGSELVNLLVEKGEAVRAATRNPSSSSLKFPGSVEVVEFDYEKPETFSPALKGIDKVFLVARPGDNQSDKAAAPFIDEMKNSGINHIVNLTAMGVESDETFMLRILEKYIEDSGISFTHLRPNWFMQNFNSGPMYADIQTTDGLHLPASDAKLSFIDIRDIAAVGAAALLEPAHVGKAYTLTGGEAIDHFQVIEKINRAADREISYVPISEEIARTILDKAGMEIDQIERWANFFSKVRNGFCAPVSNDVELVLGRPPITFDAYVIDYKDAWKRDL